MGYLNRLNSAYAAVFLLCAALQCVRAQTTDQWQDWLITISTQTFSPYLDYPGSGVSKVVKASVSFAQPASGSSTSYEDFYYTASRIIGCRRNGSLGLKPGTAGIIKVASTDGDQSFAVANAVGRIYLELILNKCPPKTVVVPAPLFNKVISAFCSQGFRVAPPVYVRQQQPTLVSLMLSVVSDPPGQATEIMM